MNFTEYSTELSKLQDRMTGIALTDVEESINVDGRRISVILGKGRNSLGIGNHRVAFNSSNDNDKGIVYVDDVSTQVRLLRPLYTNHKPEFDAMLESLTESVNTVMEATNSLMESLTEDAIPDAMIERMKGEQTSGEPKELVLASVGKKMESLQQTLLERLDRSGTDEPLLKSFEIVFPAVAKQQLQLELEYDKFRICWGNVIWANNEVSAPDTEQGMYFLANYNFIEAKLLKACEAVISVREQV